MDAIYAWLTSLPPLALYLAMAAIAAIENFFPPIPADMLVAFGSFLAAREQISPVAPFLAVFIGNVGGAVVMYALGRRYGAEWMRKRLHTKEGGAERRVRDWYRRMGLPALFLSRFLPGVRALVPPLAGALHVPAPGAVAAIGIASGIWYGFVTILAYRVGTNWEALSAMVTRFGRISAIAAGAIAALGLFIWLLRRRRRV